MLNRHVLVICIHERSHQQQHTTQPTTSPTTWSQRHYIHASTCVLKSRDIPTRGFETRSHVAMVVGDPLIGDTLDPPNDYQRGATFQTFFARPCPICGCTLTERAIIELFCTPQHGLHIQVLVTHPAGMHSGQSMGCYWSTPVSSADTAARVGPIVHRVVDPQPPRGET